VNRFLDSFTNVALFLFGLGQGVLGTFIYNSGPPPLAALAFDLAILATCLFGAWGTGRATGGIIPAVGWFVAALVLSSGTSGGSVIVTATTGGEWFLYGGAASAVIGVVVGFPVSSRRWPAGRGR